MISGMTTNRARFGGRTLEYSLRRQRRADLRITVHPDMSIEVCAPEHRTDAEIEAKVIAKGAWIVRQQLRFETFHPLPTPKRYIAGESFRYLGRQYRLRIVRGDEPKVALRRPFLVVEHPQKTRRSTVERLVQGWFKVRSSSALPRYVEQVLTTYPSLKAHAGPIRIRRMNRRWGSCTATGVITLNPELIQAAPSCIEYVIVHELCHLHEMNHGKSFHRLLSEIMPDWQRRRERLNRSI
jgi:predicted metal-dependent hydrolase